VVARHRRLSLGKSRRWHENRRHHQECAPHAGQGRSKRDGIVPVALKNVDALLRPLQGFLRVAGHGAKLVTALEELSGGRATHLPGDA
jgi:hypothetical protein